MDRETQTAQSAKVPPKLSQEKIKELIEASRDAKTRAYAPYSQFRVGAAVLTTEGEVHTGCSVDNCDYPLNTCAERTAIVKAVSEGCKSFSAIVITSDMPDKWASPCGECRQIMVEFGLDFWVIMTKPDGAFKQILVRDLVPFSFTAEALRTGQSQRLL